MPNRPAENNSESSSRSVAEEGIQGFQTLVPSIEQSPTPTFTFEPDSSHSPGMTSTRSISDVVEQGDAPSNTRKTNNSPIFNFVGQRSPKPSVSISPPPSIIAATRSSVSASGGENTGLTPGIRDLGPVSRQSSQQHRSGLELGELNDAIADIVRNASTPRVRGSLTVSSPGHARRRSSPRPSPVIHNVEEEDPPDDEFHHPTFQRRLSQAKSVLQSLASVLASSSIHLEPDSTIKTHHEEAETYSRFYPLSERKVGLVGDSGVGKSSLVNSLLDTCEPPLAQATAKGSACTCVVTEYHFHADGDFVIDVEMFSEDELYEQLAELLRSYRAFKTVDEEETKDTAKLAMDTFRSMFRGKLQDDEWILKAPETVVLETFKIWAKEAMRLGPPVRRVAQTIEECSSLLLPLSSEPHDPKQFSLWPYIRKIKVYLKSHVLSQGLILVDLPGLRDLNSARRKITHRYLWNCHEIFAVCETKRAISDEGVKTVFDMALQAQLERAGIICTHSDVFNYNEIKNYLDHEDAERIRELNRSLVTVEGEIEDTKRELDTFQFLPNEDEATKQMRTELLEENMRLERERKAIEFDRLEYAVRARNANVTRGLGVEYQAQTRSKTLHIFCVSNTLYQNNRHLDKSVSGKYLRLSGIIDLRRHLIAAVGESQLWESQKFLDHQVPGLLRNIGLWVQAGAGSSSAEEKQVVRHLLSKVEEKLKNVDQVTSNLTPLVSMLIRDRA